MTKAPFPKYFDPSRITPALGIGSWLLLVPALAAVEPWADSRLRVVDGLAVWFDTASQNAGRKVLQLPVLAEQNSVDYLLDGSGRARHLEQPTPSERPRFHRELERAFLTFDGTNDVLLNTQLRVQMVNCTVFVVAAPRSNAGDFRGLFSMNRAGGNDYRTGLNLDLGPEPTTDLSHVNAEGSGVEGAAQLLRDPPMQFGAWHLFSLGSQPGPEGVRFSLDGRRQGGRDRHNSTIYLDEFLLGARHYSNSGGTPYAQGFFAGDIAEFLLYDRVLSRAEIGSIEAYLGQKHAAWLKLSPAGSEVSSGSPVEETNLQPAALEIAGEPPPRKQAELEAVLRSSLPQEPQPQTSLFRIVLCAGPKDHGPSEHDYPLWQKRWSRLLAQGKDVDVSTAWEWPAAAQWEMANVIAFYSDNPGWNRARAAELDSYLSRGGGLVFIHYAVDGHDDAEALAQRIGLAWRGGFSKFRHGPLEVKFERSPLAAGFGPTHFVDESYWNLIGDLKDSGVQVIGSGLEEGEMQPLFWSRTQAKGRVFVSIPGHYTWTFDDPLFRLLLLRGICWTGGQPIDRLSALAKVGARIAE